jgi:hypothetical protein
MAQLRALPVTVAVVATEAVLAPIGSETSWQAGTHEMAYRGAEGLLLQSVGAPWTAPWHPGIWRLNGPSTTFGLVVFLVLLGAGTVLLTRAIRSVGALFLGVWGIATLALAASQIARLLLVGGADGRYAEGQALSYALYLGAGSVSHALYFSWLSALVGAIIAMVTGHPHPHRNPHADGLS